MLDYLLLGGLTLIGGFGAGLDWRRFGRPFCALALAGAFALGYGLIAVVPTFWVGGALFTAGIYLVSGSAAGLTGYLVVGLFFVMAREIARLRKARSR